MTSRLFAWCRRWRLIFVVGAASAADLSSPGWAAVAEDLFPELAGLLHDAVTQSPRLLAANLRRLEAEQAMLSTSSALYPQVTSRITYYTQYENQVGGDSWQFNNRYYANLQASYPLIHWGALEANANVGRIRAEIAAKDVVQAYRQLVLDIRQTYLQAVIDKAGVRAARLSDEAVRRRLAVLELQVASGQAPSAALGSARLDVEEQALAVDRSAQALETRLLVLRRLTGRPDLAAESIPEAIPDVARVATEDAAARFDEYVAQRRFDGDTRFVNLDQTLASEKLSLKIAEVNQRPKLNLLTGASIDQLSYVNDAGQRTGVSAVYVGVEFNWNIFDGYNTRGRVLMSRTKIRQLESQISEMEEDLRRAAAQSGTELNLASRALAVAEGRFGGVQGSYNLVAENVSRQRASPDDLENARRGLNQYEMLLFNARRDYLNAVAAWLFTLNADPAVPASIASPSP